MSDAQGNIRKLEWAPVLEGWLTVSLKQDSAFTTNVYRHWLWLLNTLRLKYMCVGFTSSLLLSLSLCPSLFCFFESGFYYVAPIGFELKIPLPPFTDSRDYSWDPITAGFLGLPLEGEAPCCPSPFQLCSLGLSSNIHTCPLPVPRHCVFLHLEPWCSLLFLLLDNPSSFFESSPLSDQSFKLRSSPSYPH